MNTGKTRIRGNRFFNGKWNTVTTINATPTHTEFLLPLGQSVDTVAKQQTTTTAHNNNDDDFNGTRSWFTSAIIIVIEIVSSIQKRDNRIHTYTNIA